MKKALVAVLVFAAVVISYPLWKPFAKRNKAFLITDNIAQDSLRRVGWSSQQIGQSAVLSPPEEGLSADLAKTRQTYNNYVRYAGWDESTIAGKRMLELGPGGNIGAPMLFAAHGASYVVGLDKFVQFQTGSYFQRFYAQLRENLAPLEQANFDSALQLQPQLALRPGKAGYVHRKELAEAVEELGPGSFDMIASNAVIEEIYDPEPNFRAQDRLLRPGGVMVHKIDLRDYGMFSKHGFHPLEFLTVPDWTYRKMAEGSGQPNRQRVNYYRDMARRLGYEPEIYVTYVLGADAELTPAKREIKPNVDYSDSNVKMVQDIRPRLIPQFRNLSDADLLVQGFFLVAHKPGR